MWCRFLVGRIKLPLWGCYTIAQKPLIFHLISLRLSRISCPTVTGMLPEGLPSHSDAGEALNIAYVVLERVKGYISKLAE